MWTEGQVYYDDDGNLDLEYSLFRYVKSMKKTWDRVADIMKFEFTMVFYIRHLFLLSLKKRGIVVDVFYDRVDAMSEEPIDMSGYEEYVSDVAKYFGTIDSYFHIDEEGKSVLRKFLRCYAYSHKYTIGRNDPLGHTDKLDFVVKEVKDLFGNWEADKWVINQSLCLTPVDLATFMDANQIVMATLLQSDTVIFSHKYDNPWSVSCALEEDAARFLAAEFPDCAEALVNHSLAEIQSVLKMYVARSPDDHTKEFYETLRARVIIAFSEPEGIFGTVQSADWSLTFSET